VDGLGTTSVIDVGAYCRHVEAYLCRRNDGHLIRIVGPAFDRVTAWARQGIPLRMVEHGIDRYVERYKRKSGRRRPVRIEFCEADVLDAFDDWRRAVGVHSIGPDPEGGPPVEEPAGPAPRGRRSLSAHLERVIARLTVLRGSDKARAVDAQLDEAIRRVDDVRARTAGARGAAREALIDELAAVDRALTEALADGLPEEARARLAREAAGEVAPFSARMTPDASEAARAAAFARLVREEFGVPALTF
jgi:hypothetical protein